MIIPALQRGGYGCEKQVELGCRPGGRKHKVDAIATKGGARIIVSLKWQQVSGTAEQKVPFEVICLREDTTKTFVASSAMLIGAVFLDLRQRRKRAEATKIDESRPGGTHAVSISHHTPGTSR